MTFVITSGIRYVDIDGLASALAHKQLFALKNIDSEVFLGTLLNESVTPSIKEWKLDLASSLPAECSGYIVVDVSDPEHIANFVDQSKIVRIIDHHPGFENYWNEKIGQEATIEPIGACATLIWEQFQRDKVQSKVSTLNANLLTMAIISNTLNLNAQITNARDRLALNKLEQYINLPSNWIEKYYKEQEHLLYRDPQTTIINDTKVNKIGQDDWVIGQLELWNSRSFFRSHLEIIKKALLSFKKAKWVMTSPSISEGKNYVYTETEEIKEFFKKNLKATFKNNLGTTKELWLRKEILNKISQSA